MTIDPAIVIAFIGSILALLGFFLRAFANGDLLSKNVVRRDDYERVLTINEGYATKFGEQTESIKILATAVDKLTRSRE